MTLQVLVSCMNKDMDDLVSSMRLASDAIIVNQCDHYDYSEKNYDGNKVQFFSMNERGVGLSRNTALQRSEADIILSRMKTLSTTMDMRAKFWKHLRQDQVLICSYLI